MIFNSMIYLHTIFYKKNVALKGDLSHACYLITVLRNKIYSEKVTLKLSHLFRSMWNGSLHNRFILLLKLKSLFYRCWTLYASHCKNLLVDFSLSENYYVDEMPFN